MEPCARYAIYALPEPGHLADLAAAWLGWDVATGAEVPRPEVRGLPRPLSDLTEEPQRYGFHGTVKAPFRLADGLAPKALAEATAELCARLQPVSLAGLEAAALGSFVAFVPAGGSAPPLAALAARVVSGLDRFRAPLTDSEVARRRPDTLSPMQRRHLQDWGYPYVMDEFRFHMTLTGRVTGEEAAAILPVVREYFGAAVPAPFTIASLCLCGEGQDRRFRLIHRYALTG